MATTITHKDENDETSPAMFGDEEHLEISQVKLFPELIFEILAEKAPTSQEMGLFNLILNLSIDHGPNTPSAIETIKAAKEGKTISEALAAGILQINDRHGGAIEPGMEFFYLCAAKASSAYKVKATGNGLQATVDEYIDQKKIIGGFGHRIYEESDPRAELILKNLTESGLGTEFIEIAKKVGAAIEAKKGKRLVLNIDGAIAVVLCTFGWEPKLGKAVFLIARTPGLIGQYLNNS